MRGGGLGLRFDGDRHLPGTAGEQDAGTAESYRRFARLAARGKSALYEQISASVAADPEVLAFLARPDQAAQPGHIVRVGHVERVQVDSGPPGHLGHRGGDRHRAAGLAGEHRRVRVGGLDPLPGIVVSVGIRQ